MFLSYYLLSYYQVLDGIQQGVRSGYVEKLCIPSNLWKICRIFDSLEIMCKTDHVEKPSWWHFSQKVGYALISDIFACVPQHYPVISWFARHWRMREGKIRVFWRATESDRAPLRPIRRLWLLSSSSDIMQSEALRRSCAFMII